MERLQEKMDKMNEDALIVKIFEIAVWPDYKGRADIADVSNIGIQ